MLGACTRHRRAVDSEANLIQPKRPIHGQMNLKIVEKICMSKSKSKDIYMNIKLNMAWSTYDTP